LAQATVSVSVWRPPFYVVFRTQGDTLGHQKALDCLSYALANEHVDTLAQATVLCPPFCPPFEVVFRPQGDIEGYRGRQETGRFY
jgi:hypothetical protein